MSASLFTDFAACTALSRNLSGSSSATSKRQPPIPVRVQYLIIPSSPLMYSSYAGQFSLTSGRMSMFHQLRYLSGNDSNVYQSLYALCYDMYAPTLS